MLLLKYAELARYVSLLSELIGTDIESRSLATVTMKLTHSLLNSAPMSTWW